MSSANITDSQKIDKILSLVENIADRVEALEEASVETNENLSRLDEAVSNISLPGGNFSVDEL